MAVSLWRHSSHGSDCTHEQMSQQGLLMPRLSSLQISSALILFNHYWAD